MILTVHTGAAPYPIHVERGALSKVSELIPKKDRRVCIVTDSGVPEQYVQTVTDQFETSLIFCFGQGEANKNFDNLRKLLDDLLALHFDRGDAIIAIGGGVVTDLAGFAAAIYMRGIDFYNIPTTLLSQVDASVGGKTAVDLNGYKNMIGAFWQPKGVVIDPCSLDTLPRRRIADGMAEIIKMAMTCDENLFEQIEQAELFSDDDRLNANIDDWIVSALRIKINVVEQDEREGGLRRVLNFGHTLGHAIESCGGLGERYHGECVALGMLPMCAPDVRLRLQRVLQQNGLPFTLKDLPSDQELLETIKHDKKTVGDSINTVYVGRIGTFEMQKQTPEQLIKALRSVADQA